MHSVGIATICAAVVFAGHAAGARLIVDSYVSGGGWFLDPHLHCEQNFVSDQKAFLVAQAGCDQQFTATGGLWQGVSYSMGGSAFAEAGEATLKADASIAGTSVPYAPPTGGGLGAQGSAYVQNGMILNGAPPNGFIEFTYQIAGQVDAPPSTFGTGQFCFNLQQGCDSPLFPTLPSPIALFTHDFFFDTGLLPLADFPSARLCPGQVCFQYSAELTAAVSICDDCPNRPPALLSGFAMADFSHTATLTSVKAFDAQGQFLPDATIIGTDGFDYNHLGSVPEPAAWLLTGLGLAGLAAGACRRRAGQT